MPEPAGAGSRLASGRLRRPAGAPAVRSGRPPLPCLAGGCGASGCSRTAWRRPAVRSGRCCRGRGAAAVVYRQLQRLGVVEGRLQWSKDRRPAGAVEPRVV